MKHIIITIILGLTSQLVIAGSITDTYTTGNALTATNMDNIKEAVNDNDSDIAGINSPIAVGSISSTGNILRATPNVSSALDLSLGFPFYTISFSGETYDNNNFVTNVTPITPAIACNTGAANGVLQVACFDIDGIAINANFHFVTYKFF